MLSMNKKDYFVTGFITLLFLLAPVTFSVIQTNHSVGGSARAYLIEVPLVLLGCYVVVWQLLVKRKIKDMSRLSQIILAGTILFGLYYVASLGVRYLTGSLSFGGFFLARVIIETSILFLSCEYFKVKGKTVLNSFVLIGILTTLWQYGILFFGTGFLRGNDPVLTISYVYVIFCNVFHVILAFYYLHTKNKNLRLFYVCLFLLNFPTVLLTGSRVGAVASAFILTIVFLLDHNRYSVGQKVGQVFGTYGLIILATVGGLLISDGENKGIIVRSLSIPVELVKKVTPTSVDTKIDQLLTFKVTEQKFEDLKTEKEYKDTSNYVEDSKEVSSNQRKEANSKAYDQIFANWKNVVFGTGTTMIHRYDNKYQKPHNYFAQYTLGYGLIGFILTVVIFFSPFITVLKNSKTDFFILLSMQFPILLNSFLQPAFGNIVVLFMFMLINYAVALGMTSFRQMIEEA